MWKEFLFPKNLEIIKVSELCICDILSPEEKIENFDT